MFLILAGVVGILTAFVIHWLTWIMRRRYLSLTVILGALAALGLTGFCLLFLNSDIANMMKMVLVIFWVVGLGIGYLETRSLPVPWWKSVAAVFFEMAVTFLVGAAVNLTMQKHIPWLEQHFPGIDVYATINWFLWAMILLLLILAVVRPPASPQARPVTQKV